MTELHRLYHEQGQSPWLDNLTRTYLRDGTLARFVNDGIRGVTANPTIFAKAIEGSDAYDEQFVALTTAGTTVNDAYWDLVIDDVRDALALLRATFDDSGGTDGFVSIEVAPELARDTDGTIAAARDLHHRIDQPNLFVKIPATTEGVPAIQAMTAEGRSINITLIFSLPRYRQVIEAYLSGLEEYARAGGDLGRVHSVASFFVSRVDTEVDQRLGTIGTPQALALRGRAAVAQAKLAYQLFRDQFADKRWDELTSHGAHPQRPLWASTSTKNPVLPDTLYVDTLIGPDTVNTLPEATIAAFEDHGTVTRTIDTDIDDATKVMDGLAAVGIDMDDVGARLEHEGWPASTNRSSTSSPNSTPRPTSSRDAEDGLGRLGTVRAGRDDRPHRDHDRRPTGRTHPPRLTPAARHRRNRGSRPGACSRLRHPSDHRARLRLRVRRQLRPPRPGHLVARRSVRSAACLRGTHRVGPFAGWRASPDRVPASRADIDRGVRAAGLLGLNYGPQTPVVASAPTSPTASPSAYSSRRTEMRQLFPDVADIDPVDAYGRLRRAGERAEVRLNTIASVDGAAYHAGRSGSLGGPADKALFVTLRSLADVILVGAGTMRTEGYGPLASTTRPGTSAGNLGWRRCRPSRWSPAPVASTAEAVAEMTVAHDPARRRR